MTYLSLEELKIRASRYSSRSKFDRYDPSGYLSAKRQGFLDQLIPSQGISARVTDEQLRDRAGRYLNRTAFKYGDSSAFDIAVKRKMIKELFPKSCWAFDNDAFYMKLAIGEVFNGLPVYKVGVTSARRGDARLKAQSWNSKMKHLTIIEPTRVVGNATDIEKFALSLGVNPKYARFEGSTEYRAFTEDEVQQIKDMVEMCRA